MTVIPTNLLGDLNRRYDRYMADNPEASSYTATWEVAIDLGLTCVQTDDESGWVFRCPTIPTSYVYGWLSGGFDDRPELLTPWVDPDRPVVKPYRVIEHEDGPILQWLGKPERYRVWVAAGAPAPELPGAGAPAPYRAVEDYLHGPVEGYDYDTDRLAEFTAACERDDTVMRYYRLTGDPATDRGGEWLWMIGAPEPLPPPRPWVHWDGRRVLSPECPGVVGEGWEPEYDRSRVEGDSYMGYPETSDWAIRANYLMAIQASYNWQQRGDDNDDEEE